MKKSYYMIALLFCIVFFNGVNTIYGHENIVNEIQCDASEYTVQFKSERAMISRDGSEAIPIKSGTKLTKPGTYFLTLFDSKERMKINTFTILPAKDANSWTINREGELEEILKYALSEFKKDITIKFNYGQFSIDQLSDIFNKQINSLLEQYPKLVYEGYTISATLNSKPTVQLKLLYPLKVINTLKTYNLKTERKIIEIINQNITSDMEDYHREIKLFEYIIKHTTYSKILSNNREVINATPISHTMYGGLIDQVAVCDGYAKSLMYLCNAVGIPARFIWGHTSDGVLHAWNLIQIQGAYYHVDATWADQENAQIGSLYQYFNEKDSTMQTTHTWETKLYPKAISEAYTMPYIPIELTNIYRIQKSSEVQMVLAKLIKNSPSQATVILYEDSLNKWNQEKLVRDIVNGLRNNINYVVERKYNCLIISFNKA
ncbi:transglutaminase domain-containing protein [Cellulosilyticum sp. I15G10I2]|uniref:transglutaminase domain-containing protein n=1 Tax=Cellulosilyticum sp. I15G10I2 TaxID=1892843 RepID=UPI00085C85AE|nr:transglutaminase domain-containing protein [Cellulosilyticum sp. I15G10I2]